MMSDSLFQPAIQHEFVDRLEERDIYNAVLTLQDEKRIFCLQAKDGWGKSWLLKRLYLDSPKKCQRVFIDLAREGSVDELTLIDNIAEKIGDAFSKRIHMEPSTPRGNIQIRAGRDVKIGGDLIGGAKYLSNQQDPRAHAERLNKVSNIFKSEMQKLEKSKPVIIFLDRFETATEPVYTWLANNLFQDILNGEYTNLILVLASVEPFEGFRERDWYYTVVQQYLQGLPDDAIREYWVQIRRLSEADLEKNLRYLRREGNSPLALSLLAEKVENNRK